MPIAPVANDVWSPDECILVYIEFYRAYLIALESGDLVAVAFNKTSLDNWVSGSDMNPFEVKRAQDLAKKIWEGARNQNSH